MPARRSFARRASECKRRRHVGISRGTGILPVIFYFLGLTLKGATLKGAGILPVIFVCLLRK